MLKKVGWVKATQRKTSSQHFCCTRSEDWVNIICLGSWKQNQQSLVSESYYKVQRVVLTTRSLWLAMVFVCTETLHPGSKDTTMRGFYCWLWRCLIKQIHIITQIGPLLVRIKFVFLDSNLLDTKVIKFCDDLQDPDGVWRPWSLLPSSDDDNVVSSPDEVAPLAKVDGILDPVVDVLHPVSIALLLIQQWDAPSEDLHLSCHLTIPLHRISSLTFFLDKEKNIFAHTL